MALMDHLGSWQGRFISQARRAALANFVIIATLIHTLASTSMSRTYTEKLNKISRHFIWNSMPNSRNIHLVNWDSVTRPKQHGGLGVKDFTLLHIALQCKRALGLLNQNHSIWAHVVQAKYGIRDP